MASLILEDLGTASELQRQTKAMLDRASVRPISIPRERSGEAITMLNRTLWHRALSAMESMKTLAAVSLLVSDTLKHAERRRYPADLAWLAEFDEDDLREFFGEYASASMTAVTGMTPWDAVDTVIEQWRLRVIPQTSRDRGERENENLDDDSPRAISATDIPPSVPYVTGSPRAADDRDEHESETLGGNSPRTISAIDTPPSTPRAKTAPAAVERSEVTAGAAHKGDDAPSSAPPTSAGEVNSPKPPRKRRSPRTPDDIAAYRILDAAWMAIQQHHGPKLTIAVTPWRARNKSHALQFHKTNHTPEDIVRLLHIPYEHPKALPCHRALTSLGKLAKWAPHLKRMAAT